MKYWETFSRPPKSALKTIKGGRLNGMTDINPMWRYQVMTETFGPCGIGWKFDILDLWLEPAGNEEVLAFAKINLYIKEDGNWSEAIPGAGGSKMVANEARGLHNNDECYKMAVTDALGTAMKPLGVGADIYAGLWDGSKYVDKPATGPPPKPKSDFLKEVAKLSGKVKLLDFETLVKNYGVEHYSKITDHETQKTFYLELKKLVKLAGAK